MGGDLTEQRKRAQGYLTGCRWEVDRSRRWQVNGSKSVLRMLLAVEEQLLAGIVEELAATSPYAGIVVEGKPLEGTWISGWIGWDREEDPAVRGKKRLVLRQWLSLAADATGTTVLVEDGCGYSVSQKFLWDQAALPSVAGLSSSGVTVTIESATQDHETKLWACAVTTRTRKALTTGQYTAGETIFEKTQDRKWSGVRTGDKNENGEAIALDTVGNPSAGVLVTESRRKNDDCTQDVEQGKRTEKLAEDAVQSGTKTIFEERAEVTDRGMPANTSLVPAVPTGGVIETKRGERTPGGLLDVTTGTVTEKLAEDAVQSGTKTIFEEREEVTDRGMPANTSLVPAAPIGGVIETKRGERTPGGLLDVTTGTVTEKKVENAVVTKEDDAFETRTSTLERSANIGLQDVSGGADGLVQRMEVEKTPGGRFNNRFEEIGEKYVEDAEVETRDDLYRSVAAVLDRSALTAAPTASGGANGLVMRVVSALTRGGYFNNRVETETEKKVDSATVEKIKTAVADIVRTVNRGQTSAAADPAAAGETVRNTKTPGGLYDQETEVETPAAFDSGNITLKGVLGNSILRVYMNQTAEQIGVIATNMNPLYTYHGLPSFNPRNGRWDWVLLRDPLVLDGWDTWNKENLTRVFLEFREYEGRMYRVTTTQTYTDKQDFGVKAAREEYSGAGPGSVFHTFGRDGYHYIKVTDESVETEDVTSDWLNGVPIEWSEA